MTWVWVKPKIEGPWWMDKWVPGERQDNSIGASGPEYQIVGSECVLRRQDVEEGPEIIMPEVLK